MGISSPGICWDIERTSVAWSSSLHSLFSFWMKSSLHSNTDSSILSNLSTSVIEASLVLYLESFRPSNATFIAIGASVLSISAMLCRITAQKKKKIVKHTHKRTNKKTWSNYSSTGLWFKDGATCKISKWIKKKTTKKFNQIYETEHQYCSNLKIKNRLQTFLRPFNC